MQISHGKVVLIDYTLTDDQHNVIDSSKGHGPLAYIHGKEGIIPGLEKALEGKTKGESFKVQVPAAEAYGAKDESKVVTIARSQVEGVKNLKVGTKLQASGLHNAGFVTVVAVDEEEVTVDGNHPLAGQNLNFDVAVVEVRDATPEEVAHGHVHGPGGHHH